MNREAKLNIPGEYGLGPEAQAISRGESQSDREYSCQTPSFASAKIYKAVNILWTRVTRNLQVNPTRTQFLTEFVGRAPTYLLILRNSFFSVDPPSLST